MITPAFELSQDPQFLVLVLRVPYTRTSEFDLHIDGAEFKFYAKPYFLRLTLPGRIVEDGREKATFDIDKGLFTLRVPKETAGEHFQGLQMLTSLLAPRGSRSAKPLVEDVSMEACGGDAGDEEDDEEDFDWQVEQEAYVENSEGELASLQKYGFGNQRSGVFARLQEELGDVIDVKNPETTTAAERRQARLEAEQDAFSPDHYLSDLFEDDSVRQLLKFRPWWTTLSPSSEQDKEATVSFTDDDKDQLRRFSNRSYLLDKASRRHAWLGLADILLAYAYEVRFTEGEHTVESPWTIRKLSGTLCWLETYSSLHEVLVSFARRVLCYPLHRHFNLVSAAVRDTALILQSGKACVLKCLLDIHHVFRHNDPAYILNDLYITDYCIWIQRVKSRKVRALAGPLQNTSLKKTELELELEELEEAAVMVVEEEEEEEEEEETGSSSSSSVDSEDSEAEGQRCARYTEGGGGERAEAHPLSLQPAPPPPAPPPPFPQGPAAGLAERKHDPDRLPAPGSPGLLIQELGEQVAGELRISQPSAGGLLDGRPRRNPLLIVTTAEDPDEGDSEEQ